MYPRLSFQGIYSSSKTLDFRSSRKKGLYDRVFCPALMGSCARLRFWTQLLWAENELKISKIFRILAVVSCGTGAVWVFELPFSLQILSDGDFFWRVGSIRNIIFVSQCLKPSINCRLRRGNRSETRQTVAVGQNLSTLPIADWGANISCICAMERW